MANPSMTTSADGTTLERVTAGLASLKRTKEKVVDPVVANIVAVAKSIVNFGNAEKAINHQNSSGSTSFEAIHPWAGEAMATASTGFVFAGFVATLFSVKNGIKRFFRALSDGDTESAGYHGATYIPNKVFTAVGLAGHATVHGAHMVHASVPAYIPVVSDVCLIGGAAFSLISGIYGGLRTKEFEGKLTKRLAPISPTKPRTQEEILYALVFGEKKDGETFEQHIERVADKLDERRKIVNSFTRDGFYEEIADSFGIHLDNGEPFTKSSAEHTNRPTSEQITNFVNEVKDKTPKINEARAAQWLFKKAFGKPLGSDATEEQRRDRYKVCRDRFIRWTNEACYERVAKMLGVDLSEDEGIPEVLDKDLKFDVKKLDIEENSFSEIYRAVFQAKVIHALKIVMATLAIAALVALMVCSGGVGLIAATSIILAIGCILQIPAQTSSIQNWVGKKIWNSDYRENLVPKRVAHLFPYRSYQYVA